MGNTKSNTMSNLILAIIMSIGTILLVGCALQHRIANFFSKDPLHACHCWPPHIANVQVTNITAISATINFTADSIDTSPPAGDPGGGTGQVRYGLSEGSKDKLFPPVRPDELKTNHSITLTGLATDTIYHFNPLSWAKGSDGKWYSAGPVENVGYNHGKKPGDWTFKTLPSVVYSISGYVNDDSSAPIQGVTVVLSGDASDRYYTTDSGYYKIQNLASGNYTIALTKTDYNFSPTKRTYTSLNESQNNQNFVGNKEEIVPEEKPELVNLTQTLRRIRAVGWGEYKGAGKCLCCDNMLDGDCIVVDNIERTEKLRIKQVIDGDKSQDLDNEKRFFGQLKKHDEDKYVTFLYLKIDLRKEKEIRKVAVWTQKKDGKSLLSNCELGYVDQFDRLKWVDRIQQNRTKESITFNLERPIFTKIVMLRVHGGQNRITEVEIFGPKE